MHVAVGIIRNDSGEILIARRPEGKYKAGLWEFPGGKVEEIENAFEALQRELLEELNINVISAESFIQFQHDYIDRIVLLDVWTVTEFSGVPKGAEGQLIRWVSPTDLHQFEFPDGNRFILECISAC
jgi:8-oxo-dGTP diphosphatase